MSEEREVLKLTNEEARAIVYEESDEYEVVEDKIDGHRRWSVDHSVVIKRLSDGKFFMDYYSLGATEGQDEMAFEYTDPDFKEVFLVEKTIKTYE